LSQLFSPETNCKIVRILLRYALIYIIASQLVSLQDVFSIWLCSFQSTYQVPLSRSLKTIQVQEEEQSFDHSAFCFVDFFASSAFISFR